VFIFARRVRLNERFNRLHSTVLPALRVLQRCCANTHTRKPQVYTTLFIVRREPTTKLQIRYLTWLPAT